MGKLYERVNWEDKPSTKTPTSAANFNKMDKGIDDLDNKLVEQETKTESLASQVEQIANNQIPEEYLKASVDAYIDEKGAGLATDEELEAVNSQLSGEIANTAMVTPIDLGEFTNNKVYGADGVIYATDIALCITDKLPLENAKYLYIRGYTHTVTSSSYEPTSIVFFDFTGNTVLGHWSATSHENGYTKIEVPYGTKYFGFTSAIDHVGETSIYFSYDYAIDNYDDDNYNRDCRANSNMMYLKDGYTIYNSIAESDNACCKYSKVPYFCYEAEVEGCLIEAGGTKHLDLLAVLAPVGRTSAPIPATFTKITVGLRDNKISIWYNKNGSAITMVAQLDYVLKEMVTAKIKRTYDRYIVTILYGEKEYQYIIMESAIDPTHNLGRSIDYIGTGNCTYNSGNYGTIKTKINYIKMLNANDMGGDAPIGFNVQKIGDNDTEKLLFQFGYKILNRCVEPANNIVDNDHFNPGGGYPERGTWIWDSFFNSICAVAFGKEAIEIAKQDYLCHEKNRISNGIFPREVRATGEVSTYSYQPWVAQWALMLSKASRDFTWFDYELLKASVLAWDTVKISRNGLYLVQNGYENGLDNSSAICYPETSERWEEVESKYESVMFSSLMVNEYKALAEIALQCGDKENYEVFITKAESIRTLINSILWDSTDNFYYCRHKETGEFNKIKHSENISFAMFCGIPTQEIADRIATQINSEDWLAEYGMYTVAKSDVSFHNDGVSGNTRVNWNGPCWLPTTYTMIVGLYRYGYTDLAKTIADKVNNASIYFMNQNPYFAMPEFWNPETLEPYGYMDYCWGLCTAFFNYQTRNGLLPII